MRNLFPLFQFYYPVHVSNTQVHHQEVTSVQAAYSTFHAEIMLKIMWIVYIQGVPGGMCQTSGECSLGQTIPISPKTPMSKVEQLRR